MFLLADTGFFVAMEDFFLRLSEDDPKFILNINTFRFDERVMANR